MSLVTGVDITNPQITFYGPYPCDLCGKVVIIRGSVSQGYGDIRLVHPNEPIYPNHNWEAHECSERVHVPPMTLRECMEAEEPNKPESAAANCQLCGQPMPKGEEMFNYHGYSGPCPK